ncbi:MAG: hypothetical protein NTU98_09225 [Bacteroidetes bacterium]|nr:hypothetical protein [Bacteroidota bacterium]
MRKKERIFSIASFIILITILLVQTNCSKKNDSTGYPLASLPTVKTASVTGIAAYSATAGGTVISAGSSEVTLRGVCFGTSMNPVISGTHTTDGSGTGSFTSHLTGLNPETLYFVRAYATNGAGTSYGADSSFYSGLSHGTVNGTASFLTGVSGDLSNAKVSLYTSITEWANNIPVRFAAVTGSGSSVTFSITNVLAGTYYLDIWKDIDNSASWSSGDFVGWNGTGSIGTISLQPFQLAGGSTFTASITMYILAK